MNIQNIPRSQKDIKRAFVPKLDSFLFFDYSAIEYRMLALLLAAIGYPRMAQDFAYGLDPHMEAAKALLPLFPGKKLDDEMRQYGKTMNFSMIYMGGLATIMRQTGVDQDKAREMYKAYHAARPEMRKLSNPRPSWVDKKRPWEYGYLDKTLQERGYVKTLWGRPLSPEPQKALNAVCQGNAAELLKASMVKVHKWQKSQELKSHLVLNVHDELALDCVSEEEKFVAENVPTLMTQHEELLLGGSKELVPIEVEMAYSNTTWADKKAVDYERFF